jgi:hypothetical protein
MDFVVPAAIGLDPDRLARAYRLLDHAAATDQIPGAAAIRCSNLVAAAAL